LRFHEIAGPSVVVWTIAPGRPARLGTRFAAGTYRVTAIKVGDPKHHRSQSVDSMSQ
jgi:hypothetical protein